MKITVLVENATSDSALQARHGLSLYIETPNHKIIFDFGPDDAFLQNAKKLGIDPSQADFAALSHAHNDHGGGLAGFLKANGKAKVYLHRLAFDPYFLKVLFVKTPIGLDAGLADSDRFVFTDDTMRIDDELFLFSDVGGDCHTKSNRVLLKKTPDGYAPDDFAHEQSLLVTAEGKTVLITGCSHRGVSNILCAAQKHIPVIHAVVGGFHLHNPGGLAVEPAADITRLATELYAQDIQFYTCHCTGKRAFEIMRKVMGDRLQYLAAGSVVSLNNL